MRSSVASATPQTHIHWARWLAVGFLLVAVGGAAASVGWWRPVVEQYLGSGDKSASSLGESAHDHAAHDHEHDEANSIVLSPQARRNIGLKTGEVTLRDFHRSITLPAMVVERPGRTRYTIAAPITGVVTGVHAVRGEAVDSDKLLFTLRLTHEDLVQAQTEYLRTLGQLEVEEKELARLQKVASGAVAGRVVLERQYERDKLQAQLTAQHEALRLHGLSEEQVDWIDKNRRLLREVQVYVPRVHADDSLHHDAETHAAPGANHAPDDESHETRSQQFVVEDLPVQPGQAVQAGQPLCVLADYELLYIEGRAFEQDAAELIHAAEEHRPVTASTEEGSTGTTVENLHIVFVANQVDTRSRALHFYVALPNEIVRNLQRPDGRRFITWRFKTGQRMQLRVPVEVWKQVLVLPVEAVAQEGPESYVFVQNGDRFERRPVHIAYRDQRFAVVANDGSLFPGETVALTAAHQLQMAIKNQAGGGVDPHAGHNH